MAGRFPPAGRLSAPQPTPLAARSALRAPIHNPFDKFNAQEFDAWIGDITGQLRRALGEEPPLARPPKQDARPQDESIYEEVGEDSFAQLKARRAAKGKQRATYEELEDDELDGVEVEMSILENSEEEELDYEERAAWGQANGAWGHSEEEVSAEESGEEGPQGLGDPGAPIEISDSDSGEDEGQPGEEIEEEEEYDEEYDEEAEVAVSDPRLRFEDEEGEQEDEEDEIQEVNSDGEPIEVIDEEADEGVYVLILDCHCA